MREIGSYLYEYCFLFLLVFIVVAPWVALFLSLYWFIKAQTRRERIVFGFSIAMSLLFIALLFAAVILLRGIIALG